MVKNLDSNLRLKIILSIMFYNYSAVIIMMCTRKYIKPHRLIYPYFNTTGHLKYRWLLTCDCYNLYYFLGSTIMH